MEKAYKLEFAKGKDESLIVNCCGLSRTEPLHSFGPAIKPHYLIHYTQRFLSALGLSYFPQSSVGCLWTVYNFALPLPQLCWIL